MNRDLSTVTGGVSPPYCPSPPSYSGGMDSMDQPASCSRASSVDSRITVIDEAETASHSWRSLQSPVAMRRTSGRDPRRRPASPPLVRDTKRWSYRQERRLADALIRRQMLQRLGYIYPFCVTVRRPTGYVSVKYPKPLDLDPLLLPSDANNIRKFFRGLSTNYSYIVSTGIVFPNL